MKNETVKGLYYNVQEAAEITRLSVKTIYARCQSGYFPRAKFGSRVLIPKDKFHARLEELERKTDQQ